MDIEDLISVDELWNPYDFANPVNEDHLFAGREAQVREIRYYLRQASKAPRPINLVLTGPRSAGKTSLLNKAAHDAVARGFCVARIDLNEGDASPHSLFYKIYDAVLTAAVMDGAFGGVRGDVYSRYRQVVDGGGSDDVLSENLLFPRHYSVAASAGRNLSEPTIKADLAAISVELGKPCVLLFDECDVLGGSRVELQMIRNVFMNTAGYLLIFAGTPNLFPIMEEVFSPIIRQFKKVPVEPFSVLDDTQSCIDKPIQAVGLDPETAIQWPASDLYEDIHRVSGGRPYEIQLLCHYMFRRIEQGRARRMAITVDVLNDVRRELETQERGGRERRSVMLLSELGREALQLLSALVSCEGTIEQMQMIASIFSAEPFDSEESLDPSALEEAARRFVGIGLLEESSNGELSFSGDQFDEVYARYAAAAKNVRLDVGHWRAEFAVRTRLRVAFGVIDGFSEIVGLGRAVGDPKAAIDDALNALGGDVDEDSPYLPDITGDLYAPALAATSSGRVEVVHIKVELLGEDYVLWGAVDSADAFLEAPEVVALRSRIEQASGRLSFEWFDWNVPDRSVLIASARRYASPAQLIAFAHVHDNRGFDFYRTGDFENALDEFLSALALDPSANYATPCAHLCLLAIGDWRAAEALARYAMVLASSSGADVSSFEANQHAYAMYDLAVALVMQKRVDEVGSLLDDCLQVSGANTSQEGYAAEPVVGPDGSLLLTAVELPLAESVQRLRQTMAEFAG